MTHSECTNSDTKILDSGQRREFSSGAVRDISEGKGRMDLLPLDVIHDVGYYFDTHSCTPAHPTTLYLDILYNIYSFMRTGDKNPIYHSICYFIYVKYGELPSSFCSAVLDLAIHYEQGAQKYEERNWEKGINCHCYVDSGIRHLLKCVRGDKDEPHDRAFLWNMVGLLWTLRHKPEFNDLPFQGDR